MRGQPTVSQVAGLVSLMTAAAMVLLWLAGFTPTGAP